ncbi:hypothetical protein [Dactylosporangium sp. NPDC051541]|uniref:hypothetical protein n=1 Tax=Dactylosporangium sp. NPDC051541 TaxID=3363977 RepID=UPI003791A403
MTVPARVSGGLIVWLAVSLVGLLDGSGPPMHPGLARLLVAVVGVAGLLVAAWPAAARPAAVVGGLAALQIAGYALVASRDWFNFAGAGGASYSAAGAGSLRAFAVAAAALAVLVVCLLAYWLAPGAGPAGEPFRPHRAWVVLAGGVFAALPVLLGAWSGAALSVVGQVAMWWSIPWGLGIAGAGALPSRAARRAAAGGVAGSVMLTTLWFAVAYPGVA